VGRYADDEGKMTDGNVILPGDKVNEMAKILV